MATPDDSLKRPHESTAEASAKRSKLLQPCTFFNTPAGCPHGANCSYTHEALRTCDFYLSYVTTWRLAASMFCICSSPCCILHHRIRPSGCKDGEKCSFAHPVTHRRLCAFFFSEKGCVRGASCDHLHDVIPFLTAMDAQIPGLPNGHGRVCYHYLHPNGCKSKLHGGCPFYHPPPYETFIHHFSSSKFAQLC